MYLLVTVLVFTAVMQIMYLNKALIRFHATQVIPTQFVLFTLSVILGSAVLYRDFERTTKDDAIKFVGGCALTFAGVLLITSSRPKDSDEEEGFEEYDESIRLGQNQPYSDVVAERRTSVQFQSVDPNVRTPNGQSSSYFPQISSKSLATPSKPSSQRSPPTSPIQLPASPSSRVEAFPSMPSTYDEASPINDSRWENTQETPSRARRAMQKILRPFSTDLSHENVDGLPYGLPETNSMPVLPSEFQPQLSLPVTPGGQSNSGEPRIVHRRSLPVDRTPMLSRRSLSHLRPGPFTGLSTPLIAIVADSRRRGVDSSLVRPRQKSRLRLRRGNSESDMMHLAAEGTRPDDSPPSPSTLARARTADERPEHLESPRNRARSLSNTLGDLFRRIRPQSENDYDESDDAPAP